MSLPKGYTTPGEYICAVFFIARCAPSLKTSGSRVKLGCKVKAIWKRGHDRQERVDKRRTDGSAAFVASEPFNADHRNLTIIGLLSRTYL